MEPQDDSSVASPLYDGKEERKVALPSSGVFAEAVLGEAEAAEEIDNSRFWRWNDHPIPILPPKIADLTSRDRSKTINLSPRDFAAALAALRSTSLSDTSYIDKVLGNVVKGDAFRDMGGLAQAVTLAEKTAAISGEGAKQAGENAVKLQSKMLDTFEKVLNGPAGQAAMAEFMLPGSGAFVLKNSAQNAPKTDGVVTPTPPSPGDKTKIPADASEFK